MEIKRMIKEKIMNNDKLYALARCMNNLNDKDFIDLLKGYYEGSYDYTTIMARRNTGSSTNPHAVYCIEEYEDNGKQKVKRSHMGLCGMLRRTLERLYFCDCLGFIPVVHWGKIANYYEPEMGSVTTNVFEYYFDPVSEIPYEEVENQEIVIESRTGHEVFSIEHAFHEVSYSIQDDEIKKLGYAYKKYVKPNKKSREFLESNVGKIISGDKSILGVHIRGTDYKVGYKYHPIAISTEEYLSKALQLLEGGGIRQGIPGYG